MREAQQLFSTDCNLSSFDQGRITRPALNSVYNPFVLLQLRCVSSSPSPRCSSTSLGKLIILMDKGSFRSRWNIHKRWNLCRVVFGCLGRRSLHFVAEPEMGETRLPSPFATTFNNDRLTRRLDANKAKFKMASFD